MTVLWFNLKLDARDPVLAFGIDWIRLMAEKFEKIFVLTMESGEFSLPPNVTVHSVGREKGYSRPRRFFRFYLLLFRILRAEKIDAVFAHMNILFAAMAGLFLWIKRKPLFMWHAHRSVTPILRIAVFFSRKVFTSTAVGLRIPGKNREIIGQGIDIGQFSPDGEPRSDETLLCAGRISPVKNVHVLVDVMDELVNSSGLRDLKLLIAGGPTDLKRDRRYLKLIRRRVSEKNLDDHVLFLGEQNATGMIELYRRSLLLLHVSDTGSLDKVLLEAMACGCIPISSNESFQLLFEKEFPELTVSHDPFEISEAILRIRNLNAVEKINLQKKLRYEVEENHSLKSLIDRIGNQIRGIR